MFCGNSDVCPTQPSMRAAHAVDRVLHALTFVFLLKDPNSSFLFSAHKYVATVTTVDFPM